MLIIDELQLKRFVFDLNRLINLFETFLRAYERALQANEIPNDM